MNGREIDIRRRRKDMEDYYGTARYSGLPMAMMELDEVESVSDAELVAIARRKGVNLNKYLL